MIQKLRQTRTQIEADLLISRLRAAGLHPSELRTWPHVTLAGADLFFNVEVPEEEVEAAQQVIHAADEDGEAVPGRNESLIALRVFIVMLLAAIASGMLLP